MISTCKNFIIGTIDSLPFDPDYKKVYVYARKNGITLPSSDVLSLQNQLVIDLKAIGVFQKLDSFYMGINNTASGMDFARINWINPSDFNYLQRLGGTPIWDIDKGFGGVESITNYWEGEFTRVNISLDDVSIFTHLSQDRTSGSDVVVLYSVTFGYIQTLNTVGQRLHSGNGNLNSAMDMTGLGDKLLHRTDDTNLVGYNNSATPINRTRTSVNTPSQNLLQLGYNQNAYVSYAGMGASFSTETPDYLNLMADYRTDLNLL